MKKNFLFLPIMILITVLMINGRIYADGAEPPAAPEEAAAVESTPADTTDPDEQAALTPDTQEGTPEEALPDEGDDETSPEHPQEVIDTGTEPSETQPESEPESPASEPEDPQMISPDEGGTDEEDELPAEMESPENEATEEETVDAGTQSGQQGIEEVPDPYFTSGGVTYSFYQTAGACNGAANCVDGLANPIQSAIDYIQINGTAPDDGNIYVEKGLYKEAVLIDGSLTNLNTLRGLTGIPTSGVYPTIANTLTLTNLPGGFTLSGFIVTGGVSVTNSSGPFEVNSVTGTLEMTNVTSYMTDTDGIHIKDHKGDINLTGINSNHITNNGHGIWVENQISGNLTITDSEIRFNTGDGVKVSSKGRVTLDGVISQSNANGIMIDGFGSLNISDCSTQENDQYGIWIQAAGKSVVLDNLNFGSNGRESTESCSGLCIINAGTVTLKNLSAYSNYRNGIEINASGNISLSDVTVKQSGLTGISLTSLKGMVTIDGAVIIENSDDGILINARGATLRNISANDNRANGIRLNLSGGSALLENIAADTNGAWGIYLDTLESAPSAVVNTTFKKVNAADNQQGGIHVSTLGSVNLLDSTAFNNKNDDGIYIATRGKVTVTNCVADSNAGDGLQIEGIHTKAYLNGGWQNVSMTSPASVTINLTKDSQSINEFNQNGTINNWGIGVSGIHVVSQKPVSISDFVTSENNRYGVYICGPEIYNQESSSYELQRAGVVTIKSSLADNRNDASNNSIGVRVYAAGTVTLSDLSSNNNNSRGVEIDTLGKIIVKAVSASNTQDSDSIVLMNNSASGSMSVTITDLEVYETQQDWGAALVVSSKGTITINGLTLEGNNCFGAKLENSGDGKGNISLTDAYINNNNGIGILARSNGSILIKNTSSNNNSQGGADLSNRDTAKAMPISLTNCEFSHNQSFGLQAVSKGLITLKDVNANENNDTGINISNTGGGSRAGMTLVNVNSENNNGSGLYIDTDGQVLVTNINVNNNAMRNGWLGKESDSGFTLIDFYNQSHGLDRWNFAAASDSAQVILMRADATWPLNRADFQPVIELYDAKTDESIPVTIDCESTPGECSFTFLPSDFGYTETQNYYMLAGSSSNDGFYRLSWNDDDPDTYERFYYACGTMITAGGNVKINGIEGHTNSTTGLAVTTTGNSSITLSGIHVSDNGTEGITLTGGQDPLDMDNSGWGTGTISFTGENFTNSNGWDGLVINSSGSLLISNLDVVDNGRATNSAGIRLSEDHPAKIITINNLNVRNNGYGAQMRATGNIILKNVEISNNQSGSGLYLDNCLENAGVCSGKGTITLTNVYAKGNNGVGMELYSKGIITLKTVEGNENRQTGITVSNKFEGTAANLILTGVIASNNTMTGIQATTNGSLLITKVDANGNNMNWNKMSSGETVQNYLNPSQGSDFWGFDAEAETTYTITLLADGTDTEMNFLNLFSFDPILKLYVMDEEDNLIEITEGFTINHVTDSSYEIEWTPGTDAGGGYWVEVNSTSNSGYYRLSINHDASEYTRYFVNGMTYEVGGNVVIGGTNHFSGNEQSGLAGTSSGNVTLSNFGVNGNGREGISINNLGGTGSVTITGTNQAVGNGWDGLNINTNGSVKVQSFTAYNNLLSGLNIIANGQGTAVSLSNLYLSYNNENGLKIESNGAVSASNLNTWSNQDSGAYIDTNGYDLSMSNSSIFLNGIYGLVYVNSPEILFKNINNYFRCNGRNFYSSLDRDNIVALVP
ncbi:right-handed parallel beta-helix repeat-containing protein [Pelolinea submarina]|uniref:Parallel beta helix pectate lyase-like protein n=1 Tax=Pelolinea submarina TaxID=913107 RepID=A0A347ZPE9_9CHLR|nr:right-handed parallel beta-helix repeat-containing protein [Pelolinea submarina]REG08781.1 parallel beta helix pectate lyase-like protein [Pelolinea submarina]BBB47180.1 hypothetical protein Pelsub_P0407 [Pelolinea submarina]